MSRNLMGSLAVVIVASWGLADEPRKAPVNPTAVFENKDATPAQLLEAMEASLTIAPVGEDVAAQRKALADVLGRLLAGSERVLAHPKVTDREKNEAYQFKISSLFQGARLGLDGYAAKLTKLAAELRQEKPKSELAALSSYLSIKAEHDSPSGLSPKALPAIEAFVAAFPGDESAIGLLEEIGIGCETGQCIPEAKLAYGAVLQHFGDHPAARRSKGSLKRLELVGKPLPLTGEFVDGKSFDPASLKGKVVLIDFWATWCGPCVAEMPRLRKLYDKYKDRGFEIVGVPVDDDRRAVEEFLGENKLPWLQLVAAASKTDPATLPPHPLVADYGISAIPIMFLVGRDGNVLISTLRGDQLEDRLAEAFGEKTAATPEGTVK